MKEFTIKVNEKQLHLLDYACEFLARLKCGQLWLGLVQDEFIEAYEKTHPGEKWQDTREELDADMKELKRKYWGLSPCASYGVSWDTMADNLWDMHKCMEHARYLSFDKKKRDELRWTVMADEPMAFGDQPLISVAVVSRKERDADAAAKRYADAWARGDDGVGRVYDIVIEAFKAGFRYRK